MLSACILTAGVLQVAIQLWALRRAGFRFDYNVAACRAELGRLASTLGPMLVGLGVVQVSALVDSLLAWLLAAPAGYQGGIAWLGGAIDYPLTRGAAAAIYYGERFYQLPVGLVGAAAAAAVFPLLSRHAARGTPLRAAIDMTRTLRLVAFAALPLSVLLAVLAEPLVRLAFERGQFSSADTRRTAQMVVAYALGVWAQCSIPVLVRGFYALGDYKTPVRMALVAVGVNLALDLLLVWPLAELGLALATSASVMVQAAALGGLLRRRYGMAGGAAAADGRDARSHGGFGAGGRDVARLAAGGGNRGRNAATLRGGRGRNRGVFPDRMAFGKP